jgi:hypothetical protein
MDSMEPVFEDLIVEQAARHNEKLDYFEGIAIDRLDYSDYFNYGADDGVSWVPHPRRTQAHLPLQPATINETSGFNSASSLAVPESWGPARSFRLSYRHTFGRLSREAIHAHPHHTDNKVCCSYHRSYSHPRPSTPYGQQGLLFLPSQLLASTPIHTIRTTRFVVLTIAVTRIHAHPHHTDNKVCCLHAPSRQHALLLRLLFYHRIRSPSYFQLLIHPTGPPDSLNDALLHPSLNDALLHLVCRLCSVIATQSAV